MTDDTKDAWGYVRLSQRGRDGSLDQQKESISNYCSNRDNIRLVTTLNDGAGTSGFDRDRPGFQTLKQKIEDEALDAVVVRDRARLARDFDIRLELLLLVRRTDVELHVVEERGPANLDDVRSAAMEAMKAAMDHLSKIAEIERSQDVVEDRLADGEWQGRPPAGLTFDSDGRYLIPDDDGFDDAMRAVELRGDGLSYREVARRTGLSESAVKTIWKRREQYRVLADREDVGLGSDGIVSLD